MGYIRVAHPLLIRSSVQATCFRFTTALNAYGAPALRFTLNVKRINYGCKSTKKYTLMHTYAIYP